MLFECCTLPRSDGWVWNVCGGGEREISSSASSKEKQPLTLHFPQICCEESRTPGEWQHTGDIITQMQVEWAQAQGTVKENSVPLALRSHLETQMEKEWLSAQHPCCKELQFIPPPPPQSPCMAGGGWLPGSSLICTAWSKWFLLFVWKMSWTKTVIPEVLAILVFDKCAPFMSLSSWN